MKINSAFKKSSHLSFLDIYSIPGKVKIQGKDNYSYILSVTLSLLSIITISIISTYFIIKTFTRRSVSVIFNMDSMTYPVINLTDFSMTIQLYDFNGKTFPDQDRIFYISALYVKYGVRSDLKTNEPQIFREVLNIELEKCQIDKHFGKYKEYFINTPDLSTKYCLPANSYNTTLYGKYGDTTGGFGFLQFNFHKCINDINGKKDCYDINTIDNYLSYTNLEFNHMNYDIDHNNPSDPRVITRKSDVYQLSSTVFRRITKFISPVQYTSDYGYVFEDMKNLNFFQDDRDTFEIDFRKEGLVKGSFSVLTLISSTNTNKYNRVFLKLQDLLASIGGIINGINVTVRIINYVVSRNLLNFILFQTLFEVVKDPEKKNLKQKLSEILYDNINLSNNNESSKFILKMNDNLNRIKRKSSLPFETLKQTKEPKLRKMSYTLTDIIIPDSIRGQKKNLRIFEKFKVWVNCNLSLEKILEGILQTEIIKKEHDSMVEYLKKKTDSVFQGKLDRQLTLKRKLNRNREIFLDKRE